MAYNSSLRDGHLEQVGVFALKQGARLGRFCGPFYHCDGLVGWAVKVGGLFVCGVCDHVFVCYAS